jgi:hypothetical protein
VEIRGRVFEFVPDAHDVTDDQEDQA